MTGSDLTGTRVLIIEDDYYLAMDLQTELKSGGAIVVGPCSDATEALRHLSSQQPDCALVDINLGGGPSFTVADRLTELAIPFAFVTGYDQGAIPARYADVTRIEKPLARAISLRAVENLMQRT